MAVVELDYEHFPRAQLQPGMETYDSNPDAPGVALAGNVVYASVNGTDLHLQILYPIYQRYAAGEKKFVPCIVHIHGSAWRKQDLFRRIPALTLLAQRGYAIFSVEYRPSSEASFPAQIQDAKTAVRWVRTHAEQYNADQSRIAVMGDSSGGHTALMVHMTEGVPFFEPEQYQGISDRTLGCLAMYAPSNIPKMEEAPSCMDHTLADSPEGMLMGGRALSDIPEEELRRVVCSTWIEKEKQIGPVLLIHGDKDDTVPFEQSAELFSALRDAGKDVSFTAVRNAGHGGVEFWETPMVDRYEKFFQSIF